MLEQSAGNSKNLPARSKRHRKACREPNSSWNLAGTRTRAIVRQLREVERLQPEELRK
ncbi:MAG: hypothetical protein ACLSFT_04455 [Ruminococcus callidus]